MRHVTWRNALCAVFIGGVVMTAACTTSKEQRDSNNQQAVYNQNQPVTRHETSFERGVLDQIEAFRTEHPVDTWSVWYSDYGDAINMCQSKGFPIPYTTQLTNPHQEVGDHGAVVDQADMTGTYPVGTSEATWVLCYVNGGVYPQYVEQKVDAYIYPVKLVVNPQTGKKEAVPDGNPTGAAQIDLDRAQRGNK